MPRASAASVILAMAMSAGMPLNSPESTSVPGPAYASVIASGDSGGPAGWTTTVIGRPYLRANS